MCDQMADPPPGGDLRRPPNGAQPYSLIQSLRAWSLYGSPRVEVSRPMRMPDRVD